MAFSRAARESYHLTGSDDPRAPDYVKPPLARSTRGESRGSMSARKPPLDPVPKVAKVTPRNSRRSNAMAKEFEDSSSHMGDLLSDRSSSSGARTHPLDSFYKPNALKFSGRQHVDDGEMAKITALPYSIDDALVEKRLAQRSRIQTKMANAGVGASHIFCRDDNVPQVA
eukprot:gnl/TRDRNA2_/TRDRNA2_135444_c0_seq2.p1 gnl/TRDRNA2_/TRDRNA2_135444_c0~~gnl/TRDRNA2_/TRDRNA2_135444_c0_seq2.p1  ORF type:complete len:193 (+),score=21.71 gnl/TRDRNA2_/TRDRNA2_135444_c0_seq2:71-580(+)